MTYTCYGCGSKIWDLDDFRLSSPRCSFCKLPMVPSFGDKTDALERRTGQMPEDEFYVVCD